MLEFDLTAKATGIAALVVVSLLTLPAIHDIVIHFRASKPKAGIYADKDGTATEESMSAYSVTIPKLLLAIFSSLGLLTAIALAVLATVRHNDDPLFLENWLNVASWVCHLKFYIGHANDT